MLEIKNLNLYYGEVHALKDINLSLKKNEVLALIGPSGCGKSSLIKTVNRMCELIENAEVTGQILYENRDIYDDSVDVYELRKEIGQVFQKPNPFKMSIFENISFGPKIHGIKDKKKLHEIVEDSLRKAALWDEVKDRLNTSATELSGGQQQRLCIARALSVNPKILLMDEPTSALDPISTAKIEELVINLKKNYSIIIVTHSMHQALRISDTTAFFYLGELIEKGPTVELFKNPKNRMTENYITGRYA